MEAQKIGDRSKGQREEDEKASGVAIDEGQGTVAGIFLRIL